MLHHSQLASKVSHMARDFAADILDPVSGEIVTNVGTWVDKEVRPQASEFEHADEFPEPLLKGMSDMGLFGIKIPEQYGGLDLSFECYAGVCVELARGWMSLAGIINTRSTSTAPMTRRITTSRS
jgi:butyryl-CoA dehydrogenase